MQSRVYYIVPQMGKERKCYFLRWHEALLLMGTQRQKVYQATVCVSKF
jgi:hypothetical protein